MTDGPLAARVASLDALRAAAVGLMVAWHASEAWLAPEHRAGAGWSIARTLGGLAAPLFLLAAGAAVALAWERESSLERAARRGGRLVVLGLLLRLQSFAFDHGAISSAQAWPALALGLAAGLSALYALRENARTRELVPAASLYAVHLASMHALGEPALRVALRFEILGCIGLSSIACALLLHASTPRASCVAALPRIVPRSRWVALAAIAALVACAGPIVARALAATALEEPLSWLAGSRHTRGLAPFPLLPWCAYALLGAAAVQARARIGSIAVLALACVAALIAFEGGLAPTRSALAAIPLLRPLARLVFHAAIASAIAVCGGLVARSTLGPAILATGRASLAIYWLHLTLVYGVLARPLHRSLDPAHTALGAAFVLAIVLLAIAGWRHVRHVVAGGQRAHTLARNGVSPPNLRP